MSAAPVMVAPPPPQAEVIGVAPAPGYVWFGGYWGWDRWAARLGGGSLGPGPSRLSLGPAPLGACRGGWRLARPLGRR